MFKFLLALLLITGTAHGAPKVNTASIIDGAVTNVKMASMATATFKCRTSGTTGAPEDCTAAQAKTKLAMACADLTNAAASCATDATNASNISTGTLPGARLPAPTISVKGGVISDTCLTNNWMTSINTSGVITCAQPAFSNLSGSVAAAQLPNPSSSTLGGIQSAAAQSNKWINSISTSGVPALSQPAFTDISGTATAAQLPAPATSAVTTDIDWSLLKNVSGLYTHTLSGNKTFTFSNRAAGQTIVARVTNTASNFTVTWPTVKWCNGTTPTQTLGAKSDVYTFVYDGTDVFGCYTQNH